MTTSRRAAAFACVALTGFAALTAGCQSLGSSTVLGIAPASAATITPIARLATKAGTPQTIRGKMIEKCPVAGCWFRVQDATGAIKVDTKAAGFVVSDIPLNTEVTVTGTVAATGDREIDATGLRCP